MRNSVKVILIVASSLVGFGILCLCLSFALGGADSMFKSDSNPNIKTLTATFDEVESINVKDTSNTVRIIKSENDYVKVKYTESDDYNYYIKNDNGKLTVEYNVLSKWYENIFLFNINWSYVDTDVVIEVPDTTLQELNVKSTSGSIEAKEVNAVVTNLKSTSGSVEVGGKVGDLTASATSGSVKVSKDTEADFMCVSTTSGRLSFGGNVKGDVVADNTSGGIEIENLKCDNLDVENTSGRITGENLSVASIKAGNNSGGIKLDNAVCTGDMNLETTSGSITLDSVDAKNYDLRSTSGGIKAEILSPKLYNTKSNSGSERTPDLDPNADGILNAKTTSGSIKIELAD